MVDSKRDGDKNWTGATYEKERLGMFVWGINAGDKSRVGISDEFHTDNWWLRAHANRFGKNDNLSG